MENGCETCGSWCRDNHTKEEFIAKHHKDCPEIKIKKYVRIKLIGGGQYTQPLADLQQAIDGEFADAEVGTKINIELVEMREDIYELLSEFTGH